MRILRIGLMVVLAVLWAGAVRADKADVPQTGQVLCYNSGGTVIPCAGTGQDGALQKGVELPTPRFTDQGNGTIKDNLTKLTWLKNANCQQASRVWQTALDDVASLNASGKMNGNDCGDTSGKKGTQNTDWRLPNIRELFSLVDFAFFDPAISDAAGTGQGSASDPFTDFQVSIMNFPFSSFYWSSTTVAGSSFLRSAWSVNFGSGSQFIFNKSGDFAYVMAVRGGS